MTEARNDATPPMAPGALVLGWAGVLPFLGLALAGFFPEWRAQAMAAFLPYSVAILSFLGGVRWGRALAAGAGTWQYARAVVPSLWAWAAWCLLPLEPALVALAAGFVLAGGQNRFTGTGRELLADPDDAAVIARIDGATSSVVVQKASSTANKAVSARLSSADVNAIASIAVTMPSCDSMIQPRLLPQKRVKPGTA